MKIRHSFTFLLVGLISSQGISNEGPPNNSTITGTLLDTNQRPIEGAWVTAIQSGNSQIRTTVLTDEKGRFRIEPLLNNESYRVRVRTYGFTDQVSEKVKPGSKLDFRFTKKNELSKKEEAEQFPASYWYSLLDFPKDIRDSWEMAGNTQINFANHKYDCLHCHQIGNIQTRWPRKSEEWQKVLALHDDWEGISRKDLTRGLVDWSEKIERGELPNEKPQRPNFRKNNYKITEWNLGSHYTWFRQLAVANRWDPSVNAKPPKGETGQWVYLSDIAWGKVFGIQTNTGKTKTWIIPSRATKRWKRHSGAWKYYDLTKASHDIAVDRDGSLLITAKLVDHEPELLEPIKFDPASETWEPISTNCYSKGLSLGPDGKYWLAGGKNSICVFDPISKKTETHKFPEKSPWDHSYSVEACPDGTPFFTNPESNRFGYFDKKTNSLKMLTPPPPGFIARTTSCDSKSRVWMPMASGHLGVYDPSSGEYKYWVLPGPRNPTGASTDYPYDLHVDRNALAGEKDTVYISGANSDSIYAFSPKTEEFATYRIPTSGFFSREIEVHDGAVWTFFSHDPGSATEADPWDPISRPRLVKIEFLNEPSK